MIRPHSLYRWSFTIADANIITSEHYALCMCGCMEITDRKTGKPIGIALSSMQFLKSEHPKEWAQLRLQAATQMTRLVIESAQEWCVVAESLEEAKTAAEKVDVAAKFLVKTTISRFASDANVGDIEFHVGE